MATKTEILKIDENKNFSWSVVDSDFKLAKLKLMHGHSLVTVESSDIYQEYVLLIGGYEILLDIFSIMCK